jgi:phage terminase large subunit
VNLDFTSVYDRNWKAFYEGYKIIVNQGGTSSGKTWSVLQLLCILGAFTAAGIISIVAESLPVLKRGAIRDFKQVMADDYNDALLNKTDQIYTYPKSQVEFFGADESAKLRGGRRSMLFLNEANNISKDAFNELDVRTSGCTVIDYNPVAEFWIHELLRSKGINDFTKDCFPANSKDICFIHSTYLDSKEYLLQTTVEKIEGRKDLDPNWWNVYGLGLVGKIEGLVYPNLRIIPRMVPIPGAMQIFGLDFGFTNDPTVLVHNLVIGNDLFSEELIYRAGMTNQDIAQCMKQLGIIPNHDLIMADRSEPKSIEEIHRYGFNIQATPGPADVEHGHQKVNQYRQHWTAESTNCIKEQRNFMYIKDKDGKFTDKTTHFFSHGMDARRYAIAGVPILQGQYSGSGFHTGYARG